MPIQVIVPEGALTADGEAQVFKKLTELLLRLHGLSGNTFMTPNVIGEVVVVPRGRTFSGGQRASIAIVELKVPSFVLPTQELKEQWTSEVTSILESAAEGRLRREHIFANVVHAIDGTWGIGGVAYDNAALGNAISKAA